MDTVLNTPVHVLDKILALNLDITVWTAKTKLTAEDFGGVQLPPDDIASLGNKKICDPDKLKVFTRLRARAFTMLDRCGVRFLSGWAIPEDKADEIIKALCDIRNEFMTAKTEFLAVYDEAVRARELTEGLKSMLNINAKVTLLEPNTLPRSEGKAKRVIDNRKLHD